eukprot:ctg_940.g411
MCWRSTATEWLHDRCARVHRVCRLRRAAGPDRRTAAAVPYRRSAARDLQLQVGQYTAAGETTTGGSTACATPAGCPGACRCRRHLGAVGAGAQPTAHGASRTSGRLCARRRAGGCGGGHARLRLDREHAAGCRVAVV